MSDHVNKAFDKLDETLEGNHDLRKKMIGKLSGAIDNIKLDDIQGMRASDRESLMGVFSTADSLMKSDEAAKINNVKLNLNRESNSIAGERNELISAMLEKVNPSEGIRRSLDSNPDKESEDADKALEGMESDLDVSESELKV